MNVKTGAKVGQKVRPEEETKFSNTWLELKYSLHDAGHYFNGW